jgi:dTDP-4-dehydrorhamnose reductase
MLSGLAFKRSPGIFHIAGPECLSRFDIAEKIAAGFRFDTRKIRKGLLRDSELVRPRKLCLDSKKAFCFLALRNRTIEEAVAGIDTKNVLLQVPL